MNELKAWVDAQVKTTGGTYGSVITELSRNSQVSRLTLDMLYRGGTLRRWDKAKDIEFATQGEIHAESLMEVRGDGGDHSI